MRKFFCKIGFHKKEDDHDMTRFPEGIRDNDFAVMAYVMRVGIPWKCKACGKLGWS